MNTDKLQPLYYDFKSNEYVSKKVTESGVCAFQYTQQGKSSRWFIKHNRNFLLFRLNVFSEGEMILPDRVKLVDKNTLIIDFFEAIEGNANILYVTNDVISCTPQTIIEESVFLGINSSTINSDDINSPSSLI